MEIQIFREEKTILLEARKKLGLTQTQVAEKAQIILRQYQKFENGERKLSSSSFWMASKILQVLQLDVTTFARGGYTSIVQTESVDDIL
ncbi:MAG: helix-turn-helix domain-containing protein [Oscillospiraceae bacterium]|nr:helix-turn-helix domain-containing protein [Oscillospiraceae bacterium]